MVPSSLYNNRAIVFVAICKSVVMAYMTYCGVFMTNWSNFVVFGVFMAYMTYCGVLIPLRGMGYSENLGLIEKR